MPAGTSALLEEEKKTTKYPWGETDFHPLINPWLFMLLGILEIATTAYLTGTDAAASDEEWPKPKELHPVALVSIVYMVIYISHIGNHWHYGMANPKKYTTVENWNPQLRDLVDRITGNTIEWRCPFLVGLWVNAIFVNPAMAAHIGAMYAALTYIYSFLYGLYGKMTCPIGFCSVTRMGMIGWLWVCAFLKLGFGVDYQKHFEGYGFPGLLLAAFIAVFVNNLGIMVIVSTPSFKVCVNGDEWQKNYAVKEIP